MNEAVVHSWSCVSDVTKELAGSWALDRVIGGQGAMQGVATLTPLDRERLDYRETGHLKLLNGTELRAEREYIFVGGDNGFEVFFKENPPRLFHQVSLVASPGGLVGAASHQCNLDCYNSTYKFLPDGRFVVCHEVSGPSKNYTMVTAYTRIG